MAVASWQPLAYPDCTYYHNYANTISFREPEFFRFSNHWIKIKNTWEGDSDLIRNNNIIHCNTNYFYTYIVPVKWLPHAGINMPPTTNYPRDHFLSLWLLPVSFLHSGRSESSMIACWTSVGWLKTVIKNGLLSRVPRFSAGSYQPWRYVYKTKWKVLDNVNWKC